MKHIEYFCSLNSPWTYFGHERLVGMAKRANVDVRIVPVDFGVIFPVTGGLPVGKRSAQRQSYRLMELERWRSYLNVPLNIKPAHWPVDEVRAASMVIVAQAAGVDALGLAGAFMRGVWAEDKNIADPGTQEAIIHSLGMNVAMLSDEAALKKAAEQRMEDSKAAIDRNVFGAPTYIFGDQVYWGQDRLDFLERALAEG